MKPRYNPDTGYIECLTVFIPEKYTPEQWDLMALEEREKEADWWSFAFKPDEIVCYVRGNYRLSTYLVLTAERRTVQIKWEDMGPLIAEAKRHL